jgi:hypothetical protein
MTSCRRAAIIIRIWIQTQVKVLDQLPGGARTTVKTDTSPFRQANIEGLGSTDLQIRVAGPEKIKAHHYRQLKQRGTLLPRRGQFLGKGDP